MVEQLAPVLAAEDAREFQPDLFRRALVAPDSLVRRVAALGAGRIGDLRATPLVVPLLADPDTTVRVAAAFALGLLRDSAAVQPLIDRLTGLPALDPTTAAEAVTALAKIGGRRSGEFFGGVLGGKVALSQEDRSAAFNQILGESVAAGPRRPGDRTAAVHGRHLAAPRLRAVYSLGRLQAPAAGNRLLLVLRDPEAYMRSLAARALTRGYAESAELAPSSVAELLLRAADDASPPVRINAIRSLAGYKDSALAAKLRRCSTIRCPACRCRRPRPWASSAARRRPRASPARPEEGDVRAPSRRAGGARRADTSAFAQAAARWRTSSDWRDRAAAAEGTAIAGPGGARVPGRSRRPRRGRRAPGVGRRGRRPDPALLAAARPLLAHRRRGAERGRRRGGPGRRPGRPAALARMYAADRPRLVSGGGAVRARRHPRHPETGRPRRRRVDREFLQGAARPANYLVRRWAEDNWPEAAARWGPSHPIATGRSLQEYRDLGAPLPHGARLAGAAARRHRDRGPRPIEIELLGPDAPLTVDNFLRLVDRRFFDRNRWHRVVPNFVVQDGDPRGDGFGGPGGAIRDEINRNRYDAPMLGMALSGPDTGMSQWFINLSAQPHLDGTYTVFGKVVGGTGVLTRITQGM